jgi:toxin ParE1/3/4
MILPVEYLPGAVEDIDAAFADYESKRAGLGERFLEMFLYHIDLIQTNPELYGCFYLDIRAIPIRRFPFVIYYRAEPDKVVIIAVRHGRQNVKNWLARM